jgi:hypothetical protein
VSLEKKAQLELLVFKEKKEFKVLLVLLEKKELLDLLVTKVLLAHLALPDLKE